MQMALTANLNRKKDAAVISPSRFMLNFEPPSKEEIEKQKIMALRAWVQSRTVH